jgi:hypothetical protein
LNKLNTMLLFWTHELARLARNNKPEEQLIVFKLLAAEAEACP